MKGKTMRTPSSSISYINRGARARNSSGEVGTVVVAIGLVIAVAIGIGFLFAWPVMIALGIFHSYIHQVPALGFWATAVSCIAVRTLFFTGTFGAKSND